MPNESARTAPGLRKWKSGRDTTCSLLHTGVEASGNLRIKRFVEKRGGRDREGSFDYFHPLKASPNIQSRTPLLSDHLLFQLSYTSFTFRRQGGVVGGKGEREEIGRERRSVTLQVPPRPRRSLSWATSIDNLLSLSLSPPFSCGYHWYSTQWRQYCVTGTRPASGILGYESGHDDTEQRLL